MDCAQVPGMLQEIFQIGCRIGELLSVDIKHIEDYGDFYRLTIQHSKTMPRKLKLVDSKPFIAKWLNVHPRLQQENSPLFIGIGVKNKTERLNYTACRILISKIARRVGIRKAVNPKLFN